jgi:hypothetical protein
VEWIGQSDAGLDRVVSLVFRRLSNMDSTAQRRRIPSCLLSGCSRYRQGKKWANGALSDIRAKRCNGPHRLSLRMVAFSEVGPPMSRSTLGGIEGGQVIRRTSATTISWVLVGFGMIGTSGHSLAIAAAG